MKYFLNWCNENVHLRIFSSSWMCDWGLRHGKGLLIQYMSRYFVFRGWEADKNIFKEKMVNFVIREPKKSGSWANQNRKQGLTSARSQATIWFPNLSNWHGALFTSYLEIQGASLRWHHHYLNKSEHCRNQNKLHIKSWQQQ